MPGKSAAGAKGAPGKTAATKPRRVRAGGKPAARSVRTTESPKPGKGGRPAKAGAAARPGAAAKGLTAPARKAVAVSKPSRPRRGTRAPRPAAMEVSYSGRVFRSRLEARWAVFLDVLGVNWDYEPCFYDVAPEGAADGLFYLPDFYLPDLQLWLEVKGAPFMDAASMAKCLAAVAGPRRVPLREAPYTPSDRLLLGGPFRPPGPGTRPLHTLITAAGEETAALAYTAFGLDSAGTPVLEAAGPAWDTVPATGVKAARRPSTARLEKLLEPAPVPGTVDQAVTRAYRAAYTVPFDDAARRVGISSDPAIQQALTSRRSGRPLGCPRAA